MAKSPLVTAVPQDPVTVYTASRQTITASGDSGALDFSSINSGLASIFVAGASGTNPSITFYVDMQDTNQHWYQVAQIGVALTSGPNFTFGNFGPVAGSGYVLTGVGRLRWTVSGAGASFTGVDLSMVGR